MKKNKKKVLLGFDRISADMRKKLEKLGKQKQISSFNLLGKEMLNEKNNFSGGMVGSTPLIFEGLVSMCEQRQDVRYVITQVVEYLKKADSLKIVKVSELKKQGLISKKLFNGLDNAGVVFLSDLEKYTEKEVADFRLIGEKSLKELKFLMQEREIEFKSLKNGKN